MLAERLKAGINVTEPSDFIQSETGLSLLPVLLNVLPVQVIAIPVTRN